MADLTVSENVIKGWVRDSLTIFGFQSWPVSAGPHSVAGISDRLAIGPGGLFMAFECKRGIYRKTKGWVHPAPSEAQSKFLRSVEDASGLAMVVGPNEGAAFENLLINKLIFYRPYLSTGNIERWRQRAQTSYQCRRTRLERIVERGI